VRVLAIAPDGTWLASAGARGDGAVRIWDAATGRPRASLTGHSGPVSALAIAPDGTWLATADRVGTVRIWDMATGPERASHTGSTGRVCALAAAPDSAWLAAAGDDGTVRIWDTATGRVGAVMRVDQPLSLPFNLRVRVVP
jgi:WD40 repeat protein